MKFKDVEKGMLYYDLDVTNRGMWREYYYIMNIDDYNADVLRIRQERGDKRGWVKRFEVIGGESWPEWLNPSTPKELFDGLFK